MRATIFLISLVVSSIFRAEPIMTEIGLAIVTGLLMLLDLIETKAKIEDKTDDSQTDTE